MTDQVLPHVIVLAGGEGRRLASLTRTLYGVDLPKQFAVLAGAQSLLQATVERATTLTTLDRISVVVSAHHEPIARGQLAPYSGVELVVQPRNLDTGPGMLLPLVRILARSWDARVVFMPSDHHMSNAEPIRQGLQSATSDVLRDRLALVGVAPTGPEIDYGWIVRGNRLGQTGAFEIRRFCEKPSHAIAGELWRAGALWNTFISTGPGRVFWDLARRHMPNQAAAFERYSLAVGHRAADALDAIYQFMAPANFSRDVLAHAQSLAVLPVDGSGWSDWGSPSRVFASLTGTESHTRLVERIGGELTC